MGRGDQKLQTNGLTEASRALQQLIDTRMGSHSKELHVGTSGSSCRSSSRPEGMQVRLGGARSWSPVGQNLRKESRSKGGGAFKKRTDSSKTFLILPKKDNGRNVLGSRSGRTDAEKRMGGLWIIRKSDTVT